MSITVITGIRDLSPTSYADVELAIAEELLVATELRFGGALGSDTVALEAACSLGSDQHLLKVFVPFQIHKQPRKAAEASMRCADEVVELGLPPTKLAYLRRNDAMLRGADHVLAMTDGRTKGGTAYTTAAAKRLGLRITTVLVQGTQGLRENTYPNVEPIASIFSIFSYVSEKNGPDRASQTIRDLKGGFVNVLDMKWLAKKIATFISKRPSLHDCHYIVPVPRRTPGLPNDMLPLAIEVAKLTGQSVLTDWLIRTQPPTGGVWVRRRLRFGPEEHAATMRVVGTRPHSLLLFDNVLTTQGTMLGAQTAVLRDTGVYAPGLAVLHSVPPT